MFFVLSKILDFLLSPLVWILGLLLFSLFLKSSSIKRLLLRIAIIFFVLFSNSFLVDELFRWWETGYQKDTQLSQTYHYGIVLGGFSIYDETYNRVNFHCNNDRLMQTIRLYHQNRIEKIIVVSGSGHLLKPDLKESPSIKKYLINIGIPEKDILIESESRNTYENAQYTRQLVDSLNIDGSYLLITSAFHMRRAAACYKKAGFEFDVYATNKITGIRKYEWDHLIIPSIDAFYYWDMIIHEISGFIVYKIMGYT